MAHKAPQMMPCHYQLQLPNFLFLTLIKLEVGMALKIDPVSTLIVGTVIITGVPFFVQAILRFKLILKTDTSEKAPFIVKLK